MANSNASSPTTLLISDLTELGNSGLEEGDLDIEEEEENEPDTHKLVDPQEKRDHEGIGGESDSFSNVSSPSISTALSDQERNKGKENNNTISKPEKMSARNLKRPWSKKNKPCNDKDVNDELVLTMRSLRQELKDQPDKNIPLPPELEDEETLFAKSLIPKLKRIPQRFKLIAQIQLLQVLSQFENTDSQQQGQTNYRVHAPSPLSQSFGYAAQYNTPANSHQLQNMFPQ